MRSFPFQRISITAIYTIGIVRAIMPATNIVTDHGSVFALKTIMMSKDSDSCVKEKAHFLPNLTS